MEVKVSLIQESRDSYSFLLDSRWMNNPKGLKRNPMTRPLRTRFADMNDAIYINLIVYSL